MKYIILLLVTAFTYGLFCSAIGFSFNTWEYWLFIIFGIVFYVLGSIQTLEEFKRGR